MAVVILKKENKGKMAPNYLTTNFKKSYASLIQISFSSKLEFCQSKLLG